MSNSDHRTPTLGVLGAVALAAAAGHALPALAGAWPPLRPPLGIDDRTASGEGYALTFDDGPHVRGTPAMLEILAGARATATFFLVGEQVRKDPALACEIVAAGHGIALHCDRHRNLLALTPARAREDIARAEATITDATGRALEMYRPPYGVLSGAALCQARRRRWRILLWSHWGRDWRADATPDSITALLTTGAGPGSVLLLHDADDYSAPGSWQRTAAALPRVLHTLGERGLQPVAP